MRSKRGIGDLTIADRTLREIVHRSHRDMTSEIPAPIELSAIGLLHILLNTVLLYKVEKLKQLSRISLTFQFRSRPLLLDCQIQQKFTAVTERPNFNTITRLEAIR